MSLLLFMLLEWSTLAIPDVGPEPQFRTAPQAFFPEVSVGGSNTSDVIFVFDNGAIVNAANAPILPLRPHRLLPRQQCEMSGECSNLPSICCPVGDSCCPDGLSCCESGTDCVLAPNNQYGCCPDGQTCTGIPTPTCALYYIQKPPGAN